MCLIAFRSLRFAVARCCACVSVHAAPALDGCSLSASRAPVKESNIMFNFKGCCCSANSYAPFTILVDLIYLSSHDLGPSRFALGVRSVWMLAQLP